MNLKEYARRRDVRILVAVLVIGLALYGYAQFEVARYRTELEAIASQDEDSLFEGLNRADFDSILIVDAGKSFGFFGRDWGVVRTYERQASDASMETFQGIEFFYQREGGEWVRKDSAAIREPRDIYDAYGEFERRGYEVAEAAYHKYQR